MLGQELLQRLKQLELEAAAADCRRAKQKAAVLRAEKALSAKQAVLMDESEAAERQEVRTKIQKKLTPHDRACRTAIALVGCCLTG